MQPSPIPHGQTARRLEWSHLPPTVRAAIEQQCGAPVGSATSQNAGFTPGFASVLECEDGSRHFVKAASAVAQRMFAEAYREEARKLAALPTAAPAARLLWSLDVDDWFVLSTEFVEARQPRRPWRAAELRLCLDTLTAAVAASSRRPPRSSELPPASEEFADVAGVLGPPARDPPRPAARSRRPRRWPARFVEVMAGETLVHTDVRDDNILITTDGRALLCDWNWPMVGAAWLDSLFLLIGPRGDGLDVDAVIAGHPLLSAVPAEDIDVVLALVTGYFLKSADDPVPPDLAVHPRRPALAGRGLLGLAARAPRLGVTSLDLGG